MVVALGGVVPGRASCSVGYTVSLVTPVGMCFRFRSRPMCGGVGTLVRSASGVCVVRWLFSLWGPIGLPVKVNVRVVGSGVGIVMNPVVWFVLLSYYKVGVSFVGGLAPSVVNYGVPCVPAVFNPFLLYVTPVAFLSIGIV